MVMDTAPTGHTLLLLDATGAYHREATRHLADDDEGAVPGPFLRDREPASIGVGAGSTNQRHRPHMAPRAAPTGRGSRHPHLPEAKEQQ